MEPEGAPSFFRVLLRKRVGILTFSSESRENASEASGFCHVIPRGKSVHRPLTHRAQPRWPIFRPRQPPPPCKVSSTTLCARPQRTGLHLVASRQSASAYSTATQHAFRPSPANQTNTS